MCGIIVAKATVANATIIRRKFMPAIMKRVNNISRCQQQFRNEHLSYGFSPRQHSILLLVTRREGLTQEEISREVCLDKSNTSRTLSSLEESGYIRREVNPENRREMRVYPTEKLESVIGEVRQVSKTWNELLTEGIAPEDVDTFYSVLLKMESRAREIVSGGEDE